METGISIEGPQELSGCRVQGLGFMGLWGGRSAHDSGISRSTRALRIKFQCAVLTRKHLVCNVWAEPETHYLRNIQYSLTPIKDPGTASGICLNLDVRVPLLPPPPPHFP